MADRNINAEDEKIEPVKPARISHWRMVFDQAGVTPEVLSHHYPGSGTEEDPYQIAWIPHDPRNPMMFGTAYRWFITICVAFATLAVALVSSAYSGGMVEIIEDFHVGSEVATLGISLFVLGFAVGPLIWAPLSELFGRQILFFGTYAALTAFNGGTAGAQNIQTLLVLRFFAGAFGSSPLTNAGGVIADIFTASERGVAISIFSAAPFLGPVLGPIIGGFLGMNAGWRWIMGFLTAFSGVLWILGTVLVPETYAPVLLRRRAETMSKLTGKVYVSKIDADRGKVSLGHAFQTALMRPWILLLKEPIVLLLSIYMAIIYGTLYMLFGAFPIVFQEGRHWNQGVGGLAFLGILVGMLFAIVYTFPDNKRFIRVQEQHNGWAPPEARLPPSLVGSIAIPIGLFWFAWTNSPNIHWIVSILASIPFGFGMVLVFLSGMNYLIDSYTIFAASVLAASAVLRSCFGAIFPLFTQYMFNNLGIHWASSVPAFLALACVPFPFLFYKYGASIRERCAFAAESAAFMRKLQEQDPDEEREEEGEETADAEAVFDRRLSTGEDKDIYDRTEAPPSDHLSVSSDGDSESIREEEERVAATRTRTVSSTRTGTSLRRVRSEYDGNPFDIDRVNTRNSEFTFISRQKSKK